MLFKYLNSANNTNVYALSTDIKEILRVRKVIRQPAILGGIAIHEDTLTRNYVTNVKLCADSCGQNIDEKVQVTFSGPLSSKVQKIAKLEQLVAIMKSSEGSSILDGFPAGPNSVIEVSL